MQYKHFNLIFHLSKQYLIKIKMQFYNRKYNVIRSLIFFKDLTCCTVNNIQMQ